MNNNYLMPEKKILANGAEVIFAVPTGGYGHIADEQPFPFILHNGIVLTPRYGGEESFEVSGVNSLPLPRGIIERWPLKQTFFNILRRRVNIYWKNIVRSFNSEKPNFYFSNQLDYCQTKNGFIGYSPIVTFQREVIIQKNTLIIKDAIQFKVNIYFQEFDYAHCPMLVNTVLKPKSDVLFNKIRTYSSSTGEFELKSKVLKQVQFKRDDFLKSSTIIEFT